MEDDLLKWLRNLSLLHRIIQAVWVQPTTIDCGFNNPLSQSKAQANWPSTIVNHRPTSNKNSIFISILLCKIMLCINMFKYCICTYIQLTNTYRAIPYKHQKIGTMHGHGFRWKHISVDACKVFVKSEISFFFNLHWFPNQLGP